MRRGFTLIELLVVIAMLLPALGKARRGARAVKDLALLHNLQLAQQLYSEQYKGAFVDVGLAHGGVGDPEASFVTVLAEFSGGEITAKSPLDSSVYWPVEKGGTGALINGQHRVTSYGMNNFLSRNYGPPPEVSPRAPFDRASKIPIPDKMVQFLLMAETGDFAVSDHTHIEGWGSGDRAAALAATQVFTSAVQGPAGAGASRSNYGFVDGHAAVKGFGELYVDRTKNQFDPAAAP